MEDTLIHWGVKGMKWGVRKDRNKKSTRQSRNEERYKAKGHSKTESSRLAKRRIKGQNIAMIAGAATVAAAAAYVATDIGVAKLRLNSDIKRTETALGIFDKADELVSKGESFVRSSYGNDSAWDNPIRTYAMRGSDISASKHYGNQHFSLKTTGRTRIAGLQKQLDILKSSESKSTRDMILKDLLPKQPIARKVLSKNDVGNTSKAALSYINRTGYGALSDKSESITKGFVDKLLDRGYSAVRDTNHATSPAYVLLNKTIFEIGKYT